MWSRIDLRAGSIESAVLFEKAKIPAYKLVVNFGEGMIRQSSARLTQLYQPEELIGQVVAAVCNFPVRVVAGFRSQILITGLVEANGTPHLALPEAIVNIGQRVVAFGYHETPQTSSEIDYALFLSVEMVVGTLIQRDECRWLIDVGKKHVFCSAPPSSLTIGSKLLVLVEGEKAYVLGWSGEKFVALCVDKPDEIPNGSPLL